MFKVDRALSLILYKWGYFVYRLRVLLLILPVALTGLLSIGFVYKENQTILQPEIVFSPSNGRWRYELEAISQQWPLDPEMFWPGKFYDFEHWNDVIVMPKNRGQNIVTKEFLDEIIKINNHILNDLYVEAYHDNASFKMTYQDLCLNFEWRCYGNEHLELLKNVFQSPCDSIEKTDNFSLWLKAACEDTLAHELQVTYPVAKLAGSPLFLAGIVGRVNLTDSEGHFNYAQSIRLSFNLKQHKTDIDVYSRKWKQKLFDYLILERPSKILDFSLYQKDSLSKGLIEVSQKFIPNFAVTLVVLITFATLCSLSLIKTDNFTTIDWSKSKPSFALAGLITAGMGIASAFGFLLFCGMEFNPIVTVMPFLIISIGVDDMFIMTEAWHRSDKKLKTAERLAQTLSDAALSITITSLTDCLSFAIGCFSSLPFVWMFCSYAAMGILFGYIYQLTFFAAIMAFAGDLEAQQRHSVALVKTVEPQNADSVLKKLFLVGSASSQDAENSDATLVSKFFHSLYGPILLKPITKIFVAILFVLYIAFAIIGCFNIQDGLNPRYLVLKDSFVSEYFEMVEDTFGPEGYHASIVVNNSPDLSNPKEMDKILEMVAAFSNTSYTMNSNATVFWYYDFKRHLDELEETRWEEVGPGQGWYDKLDSWLTFTPGRNIWTSDIKWQENNETRNISAFRFQIGLRNFQAPNQYRDTVKLLREIAERYPQYNMSTYQEYWPFADQFLVILPSLARNISIAVGCMIIIAFILIPSVPCALLIISAIVSIDISVIGYMSYWGVNLDCVSMITIIMSIGFAVDLSAHISYAYVRAEGTSQQRAIRALETLGWPVFQGAISTILGMLALTWVDAYLIVTFFKTVFLVIIFGLVHSLVFLPVALTTFLPLWENLCGCKITVTDVENPNRCMKVSHGDIYDVKKDDL